MAAAMKQLGNDLYARCVKGQITGAKVDATHLRFAVSTDMIDDVGDLVPLCPATYKAMLSTFRLTSTDIDTNASPALVWKLVLTNAPSLGTTTNASTYDVIASITAGQTATTYDLAAQTYAIKVAAQQKQVNGPSGTFSWALQVATASATPATGTIFVEISEIKGHPDVGNTTRIPFFS
jgi:hypothetical protein